MKADDNQAEEIHSLLIELSAILREQKECNWSRGIKAAIHELVDDNGVAITAGIANARSIYKSMTAGGCGFAEYCIWSDNEDERIKMNEKLDKLRFVLWKAFNA